MNVSLTTDIEDIERIINHPQVTGWLKDDLSPDEVTPVIHESILYLMDENKHGVLRVDPLNGISCCVHIAALPEMWGKTHEFVDSSIQWIKKNTFYQKAIAMIPRYNKLSIRLAKAVGMKHEGTITKAFLKDWELHDLLIFGLSKYEVD